MIATLRQRNFALFWSGGLVSLAGDWVLAVGLPIYVYLLTRSVLATSITLISGIVPSIIVGSIAGVFVDRWNRQRTLVVVNILLALGLLPLLLVHNAADVWIVYAVNFTETCFEQFLIPTQNALLPTVVDEEHLVPANSLNALSSNLARLGGPPLGGLVAAIAGLPGIVIVDAVSYVIAALAVGGMRLPRRSGAEAIAVATKSRLGAIVRVWREWAEGLRLLTTQRVLTILVVTLAFAALGEGFFGTLYPVFVYQELHGEALAIGELMSAQAIGGLIGGLLVGWAGSRVMSRWVAGSCWIAFGLISLAIYYTPSLLPQMWVAWTGATLPIPVFWIELGLFAAVGIPGIAASTATISLLQAQSPDAYRGRVFGAQGAISGIMVLASVIAAGTLTDRLGLIPVLDGQGFAKILAGLIMITLLPTLAHAAGKVATARTQRISTDSHGEIAEDAAASSR